MKDNKGAYLASTAGGTQTSNLPTNFGSVSSNQGGGPAGMTFGEAASVKDDKGISTIMSQQEADQAQQQINQNQPATTPQGESAEDIRKRLEEERIKKQNESAQQQVLNMLFGAEGDTSVKKSSFEKSGKHPLRAQLDYLVAKYGDSVLDTEQGKVLMGYLAGVPVERGGGLGARSDETDAELIGPTNVDDIPMYDPITGKYRSLEERQALANAAQARLDALNNFAGMGIGSLEAAEAGSSGFDLSKIDPKVLRLGLSPDQYFRFRQQLMAADPTPENQLYKSTFPFSSGAGLGAIAEKVLPGANAMSAITGGILPERNLTGYQQNIDSLAATFTPLPVQGEGVSSLPFALARNITPPSDEAGDDQDDQDDDAPTLPPVVPQTPFTPFDINAFYANLPQYTQQGIMNPNLMSYYQNLGMFPGMA